MLARKCLEERKEKIEGSKYNRWYEKVKEKGISSYLKKGNKMGRK